MCRVRVDITIEPGTPKVYDWQGIDPGCVGCAGNFQHFYLL